MPQRSVTDRLRAVLKGGGAGRHPDPDRQQARARMLVGAGEWAEALVLYDQLIARRPADLSLRLERGFLRLDVHDGDGASDDAAVALELDPLSSRAFQLRAVVQFARGQVGDALTDLNRAIEHDPGDNEAYSHRAAVHFRSGWYDFALEDVSRAAALAPGISDHQSFMGMILVAMDDFDRAFDAFEAAIALNPECAEALWWRGHIKQTRGDVAGGAVDVAEAVRLDPGLED